jgi:hypothetical protein
MACTNTKFSGLSQFLLVILIITWLFTAILIYKTHELRIKYDGVVEQLQSQAIDNYFNGEGPRP